MYDSSQLVSRRTGLDGFLWRHKVVMYSFVDYVMIISCHVLCCFIWYLDTYGDEYVPSQIVISFITSVACIFSHNPLLFHHSTQKHNTHIIEAIIHIGWTSHSHIDITSDNTIHWSHHAYRCSNHKPCNILVQPHSSRFLVPTHSSRFQQTYKYNMAPSNIQPDGA